MACRKRSRSERDEEARILWWVFHTDLTRRIFLFASVRFAVHASIESDGLKVC